MFILFLQRTSSSACIEPAVHCHSIPTAHMGEVFSKIVDTLVIEISFLFILLYIEYKYCALKIQ